MTQKVKDQEEENEEEEEEETVPPKKKAATKKSEEDTPEWAKKLIQILTPSETEPQAKLIPIPKAPVKEKEEDQEKTITEEKPKQTFLGWFW